MRQSGVSLEVTRDDKPSQTTDCVSRKSSDAMFIANILLSRFCGCRHRSGGMVLQPPMLHLAKTVLHRHHVDNARAEWRSADLHASCRQSWNTRQDLADGELMSHVVCRTGVTVVVSDCQLRRNRQRILAR